MENTIIKERLNYIQDPSGMLVGKLINFDIVTQGKDLDQLKKRLKTMAELQINLLSEMLENDFDVHEVTELS